MARKKKAAASADVPEDRHAVVGRSLAALDGKLKLLRDRLAASHKHAAGDPDHLPQTEAFVRDVDLKVDEILTWIGRTLPAK